MTHTHTKKAMHLKVVCHSLSNLISCLDVMLRFDWPTSERAVSQAGWPVYEVRFTGVGMHCSGCPISLQDVVLLSLHCR